MNDFILDLPSGIYRITNCGDVYSQSRLKIPLVSKGMEFTGNFKIILKPERLLTTFLNNRGYLTVVFNKKTHMVHRLVAKYFCKNPDNREYVNHIDGNKLNNNFSNLEWCTVAENNHHARVTGLHKQAVGHKIKYKSMESKAKSLNNLMDNTVLTDDQVRYCRQVHIPRNKEFSATALADRFGISVSSMSYALRGKTFKHIK